MTPSRLRAVAGGWLVAIGLLLTAGVAVSIADPDSDSTSNSESPSDASGGAHEGDAPPAHATDERQPARVVAAAPAAESEPKDDSVPPVPSHDAPVPVTDKAGTDSPAPTDSSAASSPTVQPPTPDPSSMPETAAEPSADPQVEKTLNLTTTTGVETSEQPEVAPLLVPTVDETPPTTNALNGGRQSRNSAATALSPRQPPRHPIGRAAAGWTGRISAPQAGTAIAAQSPDATSEATVPLGQTNSASMSARFNPAAQLPEGLREFLSTYGGLLAVASLSTLALAAVPGLAGIVIPTLAAVRIGYRQAKAGRSLRVSGIARFAGSGPIGVVRSGSTVAVHDVGKLNARVPRPYEGRVSRLRHVDHRDPTADERAAG